MLEKILCDDQVTVVSGAKSQLLECNIFMETTTKKVDRINLFMLRHANVAFTFQTLNYANTMLVVLSVKGKPISNRMYKLFTMYLFKISQNFGMF